MRSSPGFWPEGPGVCPGTDAPPAVWVAGKVTLEPASFMSVLLTYFRRVATRQAFR